MEGGGALRRQEAAGQEQASACGAGGPGQFQHLGSERRTSGNSRGHLEDQPGGHCRSVTHKENELVRPEDHEEASPKETGESAGEKKRGEQREDQAKSWTEKKKI